MSSEKLGWGCVIKMMKNKSGQFFIISSFILFLLLVFIYSLETQNTYIVNSAESLLVENIIYETCEIGITSNGSYLDSRFSSFENSIENYCSSINFNCNLTTIKSAGAPANLSLLNYTFYNFTIDFQGNVLDIEKDFNC